MLQLLLLVFIVGLTIVPSLYVRMVMRKFDKEKHYQGNGGELAKHLLKRFQIDKTKVVEDPSGDFYNPLTQSIHLLPANFHGKSLTAISVAAHEFSHALQHHQQSKLFLFRTKLATLLTPTQKLGGVFFFAGIALIPINPRIGLILIGIAIASRALILLLHLVTLPVEVDASFNKALPILIEGDYLHQQDKAGASKILRAAALTYVSKALEQLLLLGRWLIIRR